MTRDSNVLIDQADQRAEAAVITQIETQAEPGQAQMLIILDLFLRWGRFLDRAADQNIPEFPVDQFQGLP